MFEITKESFLFSVVDNIFYCNLGRNFEMFYSNESAAWEIWI